MVILYTKTAFLLVLIYFNIIYKFSLCYSLSDSVNLKSALYSNKQAFLELLKRRDATILSDWTGNLPFNSILGIASNNVPAYSNGNDAFFSGEKHYLYGVYTGIKWQCVEYARRWLLIRKGCIFDDVPSANDMWHQLAGVRQVVDDAYFYFKRYRNGSPKPPQSGSLLIYKRAQHLPFGHVAVIVEVGSNYIGVAEQNYSFQRWSQNYARQIRLKFANELYYIEDHYDIFGWMEINDGGQLKPLDSSTIDSISGNEN